MVYSRGVHCNLVHLSSDASDNLKEHNPWNSTSAAGCDIQINQPSRLEFVLSFPPELDTPGKLFDLLNTGDPESIPHGPMEGFQVKIRIDGHQIGKTLFFRPGQTVKEFYRRKVCDPELLKPKGKIEITMEILPGANKPYTNFCFYYTTNLENSGANHKNNNKSGGKRLGNGNGNARQNIYREREREVDDRFRDPRDLVGTEYYPPPPMNAVPTRDPMDDRISYRAPTPPTVKLTRIEAENRELELEILDLQSLIEKEKLSQLRLRESRIPPSVSSYPAYDSPYGSGSRRRSISPVRTGARGYPEDPRSAYPPPPPAAIPMPQVTPDRYGRLASAPREEYGHYSARDRDAFGAKESGRYDDYSRRG